MDIVGFSVRGALLLTSDMQYQLLLYGALFISSDMQYQLLHLRALFIMSVENDYSDSANLAPLLYFMFCSIYGAFMCFSTL